MTGLKTIGRSGNQKRGPSFKERAGQLEAVMNIKPLGVNESEMGWYLMVSGFQDLPKMVSIFTLVITVINHFLQEGLWGSM